MAWNKAKPGDTEKIRSLGTVIRPNWEAIEEGDVSLKQWSINLIDRVSIVAPDDPTRNDDILFVYSKKVGSNMELISQNNKNPAEQVQLTSGSRMGSATTKITALNLRFGSVAFDYTANFLPRAWGLISVPGNAFLINIGSFVSVTGYTVDITGMKPGGGNFASKDDYAVFATLSSGQHNRKVQVQNKGTTSFQLRITNDSGTVSPDCEVSVMLMAK